MLTAPAWDDDAVAVERRHLDDRRAAIVAELRRLAAVLAEDGADELTRDAALQLAPVLDYLATRARELHGRASHH